VGAYLNEPQESASYRFFRSFGAWGLPACHPHLAVWAVIFRRFAAGFSHRIHPFCRLNIAMTRLSETRTSIVSRKVE